MGKKFAIDAINEYFYPLPTLMENKDKVIQELFTRLEQLSRQQKVFQEEIQKLQQQLQVLRSSEAEPVSVSKPSETLKPELKAQTFATPQSVPAQKISQPVIKKAKAPWEEFIGTNLLNKVGITVLVLGIAFGVKYSIDHELINPLTRIILGYLLGIILVGIAYRLKSTHAGFSAVLLSGGMAVLYFVTYAAYSFYDLLPQPMAFVLMVLLTGFTVLAAVQYNLEVIGIIGLVGAYAVPILLSDGSGRVVILFSYITIINTGILFLSFKKYWKGLYYLAFILTWLTFASWYAFSFESGEHTAISLIFSTIFFLIFYTAFLAYKLIRREALGRLDVVCMLLNSFIYFGYGYLALDSLENGDQYLGLFTVLTALMHFAGSVIIYKTQESVSDIFYFVAGMVLVFLTIAVPVQLEGNWVTLVWAAEAALLFWIGRSKGFATYEKVSYPMIALAFLSLLQDWSNRYPDFYFYAYDQDLTFRIFLNVQFLTSMVVGMSMVFIMWVTRQYPGRSAFRAASGLNNVVLVGIPLLALVVFYGGFYKEIEAFWHNRYAASRLTINGSEGVEYDQYNTSLLNFKVVWLIIYSAIFAGFFFLVQWKFPKPLFAFACVAMNSLVLFTFITAGLLALSDLRSAFLEQELVEYYSRNGWHVLIRYVAILAMAPLLWYNWKLVRQEYFKAEARMMEDLFFHFAVLALLSSELIHWLDMARVENTFKLSLSILWGTYALFLIVLGLARDQKHIRLAAIILFAVTLLKLFAYDMSDMSTILKTIVMIILGALLLTASFIYNKYKRSAANETQ
ncbi:MAG: DUF2339 domain-containing protein [Cyclobacteriaceae bacterium]